MSRERKEAGKKKLILSSSPSDPDQKQKHSSSVFGLLASGVSELTNRVRKFSAPSPASSLSSVSTGKATFPFYPFPSVSAPPGLEEDDSQDSHLDLPGPSGSSRPTVSDREPSQEAEGSSSSTLVSSSESPDSPSKHILNWVSSSAEEEEERELAEDWPRSTVYRAVSGFDEDLETFRGSPSESFETSSENSKKDFSDSESETGEGLSKLKPLDNSASEGGSQRDSDSDSEEAHFTDPEPELKARRPMGSTMEEIRKDLKEAIKNFTWLEKLYAQDADDFKYQGFNPDDLLAHMISKERSKEELIKDLCYMGLTFIHRGSNLDKILKKSTPTLKNKLLNMKTKYELSPKGKDSEKPTLARIGILLAPLLVSYIHTKNMVTIVSQIKEVPSSTPRGMTTNLFGSIIPPEKCFSSPEMFTKVKHAFLEMQILLSKVIRGKMRGESSGVVSKSEVEKYFEIQHSSSFFDEKTKIDSCLNAGFEKVDGKITLKDSALEAIEILSKRYEDRSN